MSAISRGRWREPESKTIPEMRRAGNHHEHSGRQVLGIAARLHHRNRAERRQGLPKTVAIESACPNVSTAQPIKDGDHMSPSR